MPVIRRSVVLGTLRLTPRNVPHAIAALRGYERRVLDGIPPIMAASEARVKTTIQTFTPVRSGHMRANLLATSDIVPVELEYQVFWRRAEFVGEINAIGEIIQRFYPADVVLGTRHMAARDMMTPAIENERPRLTRDLAQHFRASARVAA